MLLSLKSAIESLLYNDSLFQLPYMYVCMYVCMYVHGSFDRIFLSIDLIYRSYLSILSIDLIYHDFLIFFSSC